MMKKLLFTLVLSCMYSYTYGITLSSIPAQETDCSLANESATIYITGNSYSTRVSDEFWHINDRYIADAGTLVKIWSPTSGLISSCTDQAAWQRFSEVAPGNNEPVVAVSASCTFNKTVSTGDNVLQFVFNIRHGAIGGGSANVAKTFYTHDGWYQNPAVKTTKNYSNYYVSNYVVAGNECLNVSVRWCGDGKLDTGYGEICDYNDSTKTGWGALGCNTSCQAVNNGGGSSGGSSGGSGGGGGGGGGGNISGGGGQGNLVPSFAGNLFADTSKCNYVDPPSIQIGEYLPLWWKLKSGIWATSCNASNFGKYNQNATTCDFEIKNGIGESISFTTGCFVNNWSNLANGFLADAGISPTFDGRTNVLISPTNFNGLGEYDIKLKKVNYELCDGTSWVGGDYAGTICEMNFAVTRPYLLQRGTNISTVNNDVLSNFYELNGSKIISPSQLQNITISSYSGGNDMGFILSDFISKYETLAVKTANLGDLDLYNLKKVPDKNIYIIDAGGGTVTLKANAALSSATTLIVKNGNLTVKDNLNGYGMYIVPNGKVYFESTNCDLKQTVEGIFVAGSYDTNTIINNNLLSVNWCKDGRLYIKGSLKGNLIDNLWKNRRSLLSDFFNVTSVDDRRNKIFDGSSLLIQTNTNIWMNLPPGANELIDKLQINKN